MSVISILAMVAAAAMFTFNVWQAATAKTLIRPTHHYVMVALMWAVFGLLQAQIEHANHVTRMCMALIK